MSFKLVSFYTYII